MAIDSPSTIAAPPDPAATPMLSNAAGAAQAASQQPGMQQPAQPAPSTAAPDSTTGKSGHSIMGEILHAVGNILGGPPQTKRVNPQTGAIEDVPISTGRRIEGGIGAAIRGAAAGMSQHGPGAVGRSLLAGQQEEQGLQDQRQKQLQAQSENIRQTQEAQQQATAATDTHLLRQATIHMSSVDLADKTISMARNKLGLTTDMAAVANNLNALKSLPGTQEVATFKGDINGDMGKYLDGVGPGQSKQLAADYTNNKIITVPNVDGSLVTLSMPKGWEDLPAPKGTQIAVVGIPTMAAGAKGPIAPTMTQHDVPEGMTMGQVQTHNAAAFKQLADYQLGQANLAEKKTAVTKDIAQAREAGAGARLKEAQAKNLVSGGAKNEDGSWNPASTPVRLVEGNEDPSQLSKRTQNYNQMLDAADQYSREKYGKPFDMAQAQNDYRYATATQTQNTLKYLNSLTGPDNKSGNLGELVNMSNGINRFEFPALNNVEAWTKINVGDPKMAAYYGAVTEVADQVAKIMQGGGTGSATSDAKLKQATALFDKKFTKDQITATANTMRTLLANRKTALIGDNRYLTKQYGIGAPIAVTPTQQPQRPQGVPPQANWNASANQWQLPQTQAQPQPQQ